MAEETSNELSYVPNGGRIIQINNAVYNPSKGTLEDASGNVQYYLVYDMPGTNTTMGWAVTAESLDDNGDPSVYFSGTDRQLTITETYDSRFDFVTATDGNWAEWGTTEELSDFEESHPFEKWKRDIDKAAETQPWLRDSEVLEVYFSAFAEGRSPEIYELAGTEWYKTHSSAERQWLTLFHQDPKTAQQTMSDQRMMVATFATNYGLDEQVTNWLADKFTTGQWSETKLKNQLTAIIDPYAGIKKDGELTTFMQSVGQSTTRYIRKYEDEVKDIIYNGLGPAFAKGFTSEDVARWAGEFRNDPDNARVRLDNYITDQLKVVFGDKYPPNYTYQDIALPWKNYTYSLLGGYMDERSPEFIKILQTNDSVEANKIALTYGFDKGYKKVYNDFENSLVNNMGLRKIGLEVG